MNLRSAWLTFAVLLSLGPLFRLFPPWITAVCIASAVFSLFEFRREWLKKAIALGAAAGVFLQYGTLFSRDAGLALLALLVCLKLMELKGRRDATLVIFLGYFLVMTWFFDSQSIPVALAMFGLVIVLTANLVRINMRQAEPMHCLRTSMHLLLQALPIALVLFLLFPRIPGPIWALPKTSTAARSGLDDVLSPGSISHLVLSDEVAFRVDFRSAIPPKPLLYWRGPVLWDYDGKSWTTGIRHMKGGAVRAIGAGVEYEVMQEATGRKWLFGLDMPVTTPSGASVTSDHQILSASPVNEIRRYRMVSHPEYEEGVFETAENLEEATALPWGSNPQSEALARAWRGKSADEIVSLAISFYKAHRFVYTLNPPLLGASQVDDFLFRTRSGFCEHYASSFAYLMRAAGIPARIVTGYQGGEINPLGHYLVVRQSDAHAWVEIWEEGRGWKRIDPTAIVSPARIDDGVSAALHSDNLPVMMRRDAAWLRRIRFGWDAAANTWNLWVVGYGEERQKRFFGSLGMQGATLRDIAATLAVALSVLILVGTSVLMLRLQASEKDRVQRIYLEFCRKMARRGIRRMPSEGPVDYGKRIVESMPDLREPVSGIVDLYVKLRYGSGGSREETAMFAKRVGKLR